MPLQRNQPSPERQSVLSFVSPSVADLLFFETVDAKTVGAGGGKTVTAISSAVQAVEVTAAGTYDGDYHESGFLIQVTSAAHGYVVGDVVTIINAPDGPQVGSFTEELKANGTFEIRVVDTNTFKYFVRGSGGIGAWDAAAVTAANTIVYKSHPQYGAAHPDTDKFPTHKLCYVKPADEEGLHFQYYYAAERQHQDDYNFEFSQADLGGNKYDTVVRTYVNLRSDFSDTDTEYQAGDAMPATPAYTFGDTYILMTRQQKRIGDQELDGLFVVEQRVYFNRVDIVNQNLDPATGGVLETTQTLYYRGEPYVPASSVAIETAAGNSPYWALSAAGINSEVEQLSHDWWKVTVQDVIPQGISGLTHGGKLLRTFTTYQSFSWPPVVDGLVFTTAPKKDGSAKTVVTVRNKEGKDGFAGPTKMVVEQVWSLDALTPPPVTVFKTASGVYDGVQFSVRIANSLTESITLTDFIGTKDPVYKLGEYGFPKPWLLASSPTDWPATHVGAATQKPFRGGYLLEVVTVHEPA